MCILKGIVKKIFKHNDVFYVNTEADLDLL